MTIAPSGTIRIECTITGAVVVGPALNVWHAQVNDLPGLTQSQAMVDRIRDFYTALQARMSNNCTVTVGARVIDLGSEPDVLVLTTPRVVTGTGIGDWLPRATSYLLALKGGALSRRYQGRLFLPFNLESDNNFDGTPTAALRTAVQTAANALPGSPSPSTVPYLGIFSRRDSVVHPLFSAVARSQWAVLRSRRD